MTLYVVAQITAAEGKEALLRHELEKLIAPTRLEEGCLQYDLHVDDENPGFFVFYENWTSDGALSTHSQSAHIAAFRAATEGAVARFMMNKMTKVE